jgi:hypothetical protein
MTRLPLILACLATPAAAETVCVPGADLAAAAREQGLALTFEGFLTDGAVLIFTARDGEWVMVILRADGSACPVAAGNAHDITLGSLI